MRILLISRCPPFPLYLGDRLIVYHLADELEARHHEIDLLAFADRLDDFHEQDEYNHLFNHVQLIPEARRTQFSYLRRALFPSARWPQNAEQSWSPEMWRAIEARLESTHYDAIHLFGGIQVYEFLGALGGIPAIITPYESYSLYLRRIVESVGEGIRRPSLSTRYLLTLLQLRLAQHFESWMFTPYSRTIVLSEPDRDELLTLNPSLKIDVIPNGVDTYEFRPRPVKRIPTLLFVGNYEYPPNVDAALRLANEIFPRVQKQLPAVRLWLVGNAPPPELRALQSQNRNASIRVTGRVPDVRPYLARAGVFVSPLRLGAGIKNKVLEALAMGCPVVATPLSVDGIAVQNGHDALIAADDDALVEAIVRVLQDADLQNRLSTNGRKLIEAHYSWNHVAELYEDLYEKYHIE